MKKLLLTIAPHGASIKLDMAKEIAIISKQSPVEIYPDEALTIIGERGHSFYPGTFTLNDKSPCINGDSPDHIYVLALDFDGSLSLRMVLDRLREYGLDCTGIYISFSDDTDLTLPNDQILDRVKRYRVVIVLESPVVGRVEYEELISMASVLFPEADRRNTSTVFYGGKKVIYRNVEYSLNVPDFVMASVLYKAKNCNKSQSIRKNIQKSLDAAPNHLLSGDSFTATCNTISIQPTVFEPVRINGWSDKMRECSELVDGFIRCDRKYWHNELLGLYLTMRLFVNGFQLWSDSIRNNPLINYRKIYEIHGFISKFEAMGRGLYHEMALGKFAPNDSAAGYCYKLSDLVHLRGSKARKIKGTEVPPISLRDARLDTGYLFKHILSKWDTNVSVLKINTGVGKSYQIAACRHLDECVIACKTHHLVQELSRELSANGIEHHVIPELPDLPDLINREYHSLLEIGAHDAAAGFLRSLISDPVIKYRLERLEVTKLRRSLMRYFNAIERAVGDTLPVLCTHKRLFFTEFPNHSMAIVDEDIMESIGEVKTVSASTIKQVLNVLNREDHPGITSFLIDLLDRAKSPSELMKVVPTVELFSGKEYLKQHHVQELIDMGVKEKVLSLLRSEFVIFHPTHWKDQEGEKSFSFIVRHNLPSGLRWMILSATVDNDIYSKLFGKLDFFDISNVQLAGHLRQFSSRSFSRSTFDNAQTQELAQKIGELVGSRPVITHKGNLFQKYFENPFRHMEDVMGTNELTGQDIVVLGLPGKPPYVYLLWAALLDVDVNNIDTEFKQRTVKRNYSIFNMQTFGDPVLQNLHCYFIESPLVQAVGRVRPYEYPVTVDIFCNYPVPGAIQYHLDEMDIIADPCPPSSLEKMISDVYPMYFTSGSIAS